MNQLTARLRRLAVSPLLLSLAVFVTPLALYVATLAPSVVPGDPGEYQSIPHVLGIAHPPGYVFFTVLAKAWTSLVRIGSIAYRTNLLAAAAGAWTALMVYHMTRLLANERDGAGSNAKSLTPSLAALFAAAVLATSTDLWQHSTHANSHVVSAALSATTLYAGLRWWATRQSRWLYGFAFLAALGVTHHPLLAFGAPAYVAFVLAVYPRLLRDWRRLGGIALALLLGLALFLYLPLRAGATPFGPAPNWDDIVGHATARGIRVNLFHFGLGDQPVRWRVFWGLLRLQFNLPTLALAAVGLLWLARRRPRPFVLLSVFYAVNLVFIINTVQDVMAYLLLPFTTTALWAGAGVLALLTEGLPRLREPRWQKAALAVLALLLAVGPLTTARHRAPRLSLRDYRLADQYIQAVLEQFDGQGQGAWLLAPWEWMTPLFYAQHVQGKHLDPQDVQVIYVAAGTANPWVDNVWAHIEDGPVYLTDYRPQVAAAGLRLRPVGDWPLYRVEGPPATRPPDIAHPLDLWAGDAVHLLGWDLDRTALRTGETAHLTLYMSAPQKLEDYYSPYLWLGERLYRWTTDSRLNTPWWEPGEIVVERYEITVPFGTPPGDYPLVLGFTDVSQGQDLGLTLTLPPLLHVQAASIEPPGDVLAAARANVNSRIALLGGRASARGRTVKTPWTEPLPVYPGDRVQVWLDWRALTSVDQPYTVFVHLIDGAGRPLAQHDYTPMGGAFPTFLWIPRWIEGQTISDPYTLTVPPDAPPGDYWIEAGMYGMTSLRRAYHFDPAGNLAGDRYILGQVQVQTP
jgi:4-amino-4-deoxy-L-arabinose transferase-like glycosyltransferase